MYGLADQINVTTGADASGGSVTLSTDFGGNGAPSTGWYLLEFTTQSRTTTTTTATTIRGSTAFDPAGGVAYVSQAPAQSPNLIGDTETESFPVEFFLRAGSSVQIVLEGWQSTDDDVEYEARIYQTVAMAHPLIPGTITGTSGQPNFASTAVDYPMGIGTTVTFIDPAGGTVNGFSAKITGTSYSTGTTFLIDTNLPANLPVGVIVQPWSYETASVASVSGNVEGDVKGDIDGSLGGNVQGDVDGSVQGDVIGTVASVTGAVGSVTGNVGGSVDSVVNNVGGSVASVTNPVELTTNSINLVSDQVHTEDMTAHQAVANSHALRQKAILDATGADYAQILEASAHTSGNDIVVTAFPYENGVPVTSGVSSPTIVAVDHPGQSGPASNKPNTAMSFDATNGLLHYTWTDGVTDIPAGAAVVFQIDATVNGNAASSGRCQFPAVQDT